MERPSWIDLLLAAFAGGLLWLPFQVTGLLAGALPAVCIAGLGAAIALPVLTSFNRSFAHAGTRRMLAKIAVLLCFGSLAAMMWLVITAGLAAGAAASVP